VWLGEDTDPRSQRNFVKDKRMYELFLLLINRWHLRVVPIFVAIFVVACAKETVGSDYALLLEKSDNQTTTIFSVYPDGSNFSQVMEFDFVYTYWFSPNGKYVVLINRPKIDDPDLPPGTLQVVEVKNEKVLRRIDDVNHFALEMFDYSENVTWSHHGDKFVFLRESKEGNGINLWLYDLNTNSLNQLTYGEAIDRAPAWSPDDQKIAFVTLEACDGSPWNCAPAPDRDGELYWKISTIDAIGTNYHIIADFEESGLLQPSVALTMFCNLVWSPDGQYIAFENLCDLDRPFPTEKDVFVTATNSLQTWQVTHFAQNRESSEQLQPVTFFSFHWLQNDLLSVGFSTIPQELFAMKEGEFSGGFLFIRAPFVTADVQEIVNARTGSASWSPNGHYVIWFSESKSNNLWIPQNTTLGEISETKISELSSSSIYL
jgi:dipeptidyl aminopeptidase/acylaminoacyl peptidase